MVQLGWSNICAHKLRSSLAVLMIAVGIGTVIAIVTVAEGQKQALLNALAEFYRADVIYMKGAQSGERLTLQVPRVFSERDAQRIAQLKDVKAVGLAGQLEGAVLAYQGTPLPVGRVMASFNLSSFFGLEQGRFPQAKGEIVLGSFIAEELKTISHRDSVVGQSLTLKYLENGQILEDQLQVVGVFKRVPVNPDQLGLSGVQGTDAYVSMDYLAPNQTIEGQKIRFVEELFIQVKTVQNLKAVKEQAQKLLMNNPTSDFMKLIEKLIQGKRSIGLGFGVRVQEEVAKGISEAIFRVAGFVSAIGGFALLVGLLGITAVMIISVTERTREIGILRAIGASRSAVMRLFLAEAVILCVVGAGLAIGFGMAASFVVKGLMTLFLETDLEIPLVFLPGWYAIALFTGVFMGLLGGLYPSWRAARVDPIEALRYE